MAGVPRGGSKSQNSAPERCTGTVFLSSGIWGVCNEGCVADYRERGNLGVTPEGVVEPTRHPWLVASLACVGGYLGSGNREWEASRGEPQGSLGRPGTPAARREKG